MGLSARRNCTATAATVFSRGLLIRPVHRPAGTLPDMADEPRQLRRNGTGRAAAPLLPSRYSYTSNAGTRQRGARLGGATAVACRVSDASHSARNAEISPGLTPCDGKCQLAVRTSSGTLYSGCSVFRKATLSARQCPPQVHLRLEAYLVMSGRRMASALLSRCALATRVAPHVELSAASLRVLAAPIQPQQLSCLPKSSSIPSRTISRGYAADSDHKPHPSLRDALQTELDFENENEQSTGVSLCLDAERAVTGHACSSSRHVSARRAPASPRFDTAIFCGICHIVSGLHAVLRR